MQITDEMALRAARREANFDGYDCFEAMSRMSRERYIARSRAALEAALGATEKVSPKLLYRLKTAGRPYSISSYDPPSPWFELCEDSAACIEDLAAALAEFKDMPTCHDWYEVRRKGDLARAALERWGLK